MSEQQAQVPPGLCVGHRDGGSTEASSLLGREVTPPAALGTNVKRILFIVSVF